MCWAGDLGCVLLVLNPGPTRGMELYVVSSSVAQLLLKSEDSPHWLSLASSEQGKKRKLTAEFQYQVECGLKHHPSVIFLRHSIVTKQSSTGEEGLSSGGRLQ